MSMSDGRHSGEQIFAAFTSRVLIRIDNDFRDMVNQKYDA